MTETGTFESCSSTDSGVRRCARDYTAFYQTDGSNLPWNLIHETPTLRENADTYEQFTLDFFLP